MLTRYWALDVFGRLQVDFDEASYNFELMEKHRALVDNAQLKLLLNLSTVLLKRQKQPNGIGNTSGDSDIFDPRLVCMIECTIVDALHANPCFRHLVSCICCLEKR